MDDKRWEIGPSARHAYGQPVNNRQCSANANLIRHYSRLYNNKLDQDFCQETNFSEWHWGFTVSSINCDHSTMCGQRWQTIKAQFNSSGKLGPGAAGVQMLWAGLPSEFWVLRKTRCPKKQYSIKILAECLSNPTSHFNVETDTASLLHSYVDSLKYTSVHHYKHTYECDWLSMVLRLHQHNIGYTADGFYRSDDPTNSVKALKAGG